MYYFKFKIPTNADGSRVSYSPGWHGTLAKCPKNVTVLIYNDKEGWGLAQTDDTFIPKEVAVLTENDASAILQNTKSEDAVFVGKDAITARWEKQKEDMLAENAALGKELNG